MAQFDTKKQRYNLNNNTLHETSIITHTDGGEVSAVNPWGKQVLLVDDDTVQHTSQNRRKVSHNEIIDYASYAATKATSIWDELVTGTASSTHDPFLGMVNLEVGGTAGDEIVRQTRRVQKYIPGRQNVGSMAVIFGAPIAGICRRFGVYDETDGVYFEQEGANISCVIRRNTVGGVVEDRVVRENWNGDKLDGNGPSGIDLDFTKIQLVMVEYEWYGAGQVEFNFIINNNKYAVHQFDHANTIDHSWASRGQFPVRVEIKNITGVAGTHSFKQGSHSFSTEGRTERLGRQKSVSTALAGRPSASVALEFAPLVAIRLKADRLSTVVEPTSFTAGAIDNIDCFIAIVEGATIVGGTWVSLNDDSNIEYNITGTSYTNGTVTETLLITKGNGDKIQIGGITQLERSTTTALGDTAVTYMLAGATAPTGSKQIFAALDWMEVR